VASLCAREPSTSCARSENNTRLKTRKF